MYAIKQAEVLLFGQKIGELYQTAKGFSFAYLPDYQGIPLSLSLPVEKREFFSESLFPYFASLIPEGWLKAKYVELQKIDEQDIFGLLLNNGENLLGAVQILRRGKNDTM